MKGMRTIIVRGDEGVPAYILKVSPGELEGLEKANLVYVESDKPENGLAFNHIGVDLLRISDQLADISPKNFKELVPIYVERKIRQALIGLLATEAFEGMTYTHFVDMSISSLVRGVTRKAFDIERVQIEAEAKKHGVPCSCIRKRDDIVYQAHCLVHGNWSARYKEAMQVIPRLHK